MNAPTADLPEGYLLEEFPVVDKKCAGRVMGRGAVFTREIEVQSGASINFDNERAFRLIGRPEQIAAAKMLLQARVNQCTNKGYWGRKWQPGHGEVSQDG